MKKTIIIPLALTGLLLSSGAAFAWSGHHGKGNCENSPMRNGQGMSQEQHQQRMSNHLEKMAVVLDLTDSQKTQIEKLMNEKWENRQAMRTQLQENRKELRESKQGTTFNEAEFRAKAQKQADLKTEMMVQHAKTKQQLFAVLTPEQQQKAEKLQGMRGEGFFSGQNGNCNGAGNGKHNGQGKHQRKGSGQYYSN